MRSAFPALVQIAASFRTKIGNTGNLVPLQHHVETIRNVPKSPENIS